MALTRRMTGASLAMSRRCSRSASGLLVLAVGEQPGVRPRRNACRWRRGFPARRPAPCGFPGRRTTRTAADGFEIQRVGHGQRQHGIRSAPPERRGTAAGSGARALRFPAPTGGGPSIVTSGHVQAARTAPPARRAGRSAPCRPGSCPACRRARAAVRARAPGPRLRSSALHQHLAQAQVARARRDRAGLSGEASVSSGVAGVGGEPLIALRSVMSLPAPSGGRPCNQSVPAGRWCLPKEDTTGGPRPRPADRRAAECRVLAAVVDHVLHRSAATPAGGPACAGELSAFSAGLMAGWNGLMAGRRRSGSISAVNTAP